MRYYAVLAPVSRSYSPLEGRLVTCYSPGRHFTHGLLHFLVRLACVRHAASVDSEPGSNSRLKPDSTPTLRRGPECDLQTGSHGDPRHAANNADSRRHGIHRAALTYFVRSLGLESSFYLTTGTFNQIVKDRFRLPPERFGFDFRLAGSSPTCPRNLLSHCAVRH